jgi:hypothetical protein
MQDRIQVTLRRSEGNANHEYEYGYPNNYEHEVHEHL